MSVLKKIELSFSIALSLHVALLVNTLMYPSQVNPATLPDHLFTQSQAAVIPDEPEPRAVISPFQKYIDLNDDFKGWLSIDGTVIDHPVVQTINNNYYLEYTFEGEKSKSGAIYFDYRNKCNFYDNHTVIYGHYMLDGSMFHDLHHYKDEAFFLEHPYIVLQGLRETKTYEIFSVHIVSAYTYYLRLGLEDALMPEYAAHFKRLSLHQKDIVIPKNPRLLTLATCTHEFENARILIHAIEK